jgi:hypothetical protein
MLSFVHISDDGRKDLTKGDTDGEVLQARVRYIGIVVIYHRNSEVYHASHDAAAIAVSKG